MKKVIAVALIAIIAIFGCAQAVSAYSIDLESQTPTEVTSGETFTLTVSLDENTPLANGHIKYDTKLFEFVEANQDNMSAHAYTEEEYVSWMYTDTGSAGVKSYTFTFKAKDVSKTSTGTFSLSDAVFIAESEETYEGETIKGKSAVDVTIKVKENAEDTSNNTTDSNNNTSNVDKEQGKKDNTITSDSKLPQTGKGIIAYILMAIILLAVVFKFKYKKINKLFTLLVLPLTISMIMCSTNVSALKLADTEKYQAGLFDSLVEGEKIVAINPGKSYYQTEDLSLEMLQSIFSEENLTIDSIKNKDGNSITEKIATGDKVVLTDESEYTVLLYGDANGDGIICNASDVSVIRNEYVKGERADDIYRLAADLSPDNILNVKDVAIIVKKYTAKTDGPLVTPFPDDDYELPKQKIEDENVLKITSVETTSNEATINIELDTTGLTANSITYEIYDAENNLTKTHTVLDLTSLSHTFDELEANKEYFVIVTLDCDEANYYTEQTVETKASTAEEPENPDEPVAPENPIDRAIEAELKVTNIKAGSADMEIVLAEGTTLEDDDKIFFGHSAGSHGGQTQWNELTYKKTDLEANKEQTFWATIYDKDDNILWFSEYQREKTPAIEFDLLANKDVNDPKTKISATLSNINSDEFDFEKIQCKVEQITSYDEGEPSAWTVVLDEEIKSLDTSITLSKLTPGETYNVEVRIYDTAGNYTKKVVENITMDSDSTTEPDQPVEPDEPIEPEEPRELTAELEVIDIGEDSIKVKMNLSDELLDSETISYAIVPAANGVATSGFITDTEYTFSGLSKNVSYVISATVYDEDRAEMCKTETITAIIVEDSIEISEVETTANSIKVKLSGAPDRTITENDKIIFKITDTNNNIKATSIEYSIGEANAAGHTFTDLNPNTQYYAYAILQNENGITATSNTLNITTNKVEQSTTPEEPVTPGEETTEYTATLQVDSTTVTTSSLVVNLDITPNLENYSVKYYVNGTQSYESTESNYTFENLKAGETYAFWAEVYNEDGEKVATTDMITQLMPSPDFTMFVEANAENPESSIFVSATPYLVNCSIEKYDMWISKVNVDDSTYTDVKAIKDVPCDDGAFEDYEIKGLEANTKYIVTVKATDNGGNTVTKTANITTAEAPRELEGYLEVTKNFEGTVDLKINITNGEINTETDEIYFKNATTNPKEWEQSTEATYSFTDVNEGLITFSSKVIDTLTGKEYNIEPVEVKVMSMDDISIKSRTTSTITITGTLPSQIADETIVYRIKGPNGYEDKYETTLVEINSLTFTHQFTGLEDSAQYTIWCEIEDASGNIVTKTNEIFAMTIREFEADLELVSTSEEGQATVKLNAIKGELLNSDVIKYAWINQGEIFKGNMTEGTTEYTFTDLSVNTPIQLMTWVFDENNIQIGYDSIEITIRKVEITKFEIDKGIAKNVIAATVVSEATGTKSTDNIVYEIRKKGEASSIANEGEIGSYKYQNLISGETYYFTLKIYDEEWNLMATSEEIEYTVPIPSISVLLANKEENPSTQIVIRVENPKETVGCTPTKYDYYIYKVNEDGSTTEVKRNLGATSNEWTATDLLPSTEYKVVVTATDENNNTSATTEGTITTEEAVDTIIVRPTDGAVIDNYDPRPGYGNQYKNAGFSSIDVITCDDEDLLNLPVSGTLEIEVTNATIFSSVYNESLKYLEGASYSVENGKVIITLEEVTLARLEENLPIVLTIADNLTEEDTVSITTTTNLTLDGREDITFEGQTIDLPIVYKVDETPEIELNVNYEANSDKATATIDVTNLAKIDKYYYKLYKYGYSNGLYPVEGSDGSWIESDKNEYVFDNLSENTTYLVVVKAESIQGNYSEEKKYEFTTTNFKPQITLTATSTDEYPATQITVEAAVTNAIAIKNYQFALIDNEHTTEDGKAIYIEMPVEENSQNSYNFIGLYPNTKYTAFGQAESEKGVMSNYQNKTVFTEVIRDELKVADQTTTDSITVTAEDTNLRTALYEINSRVGIYNIDLSECYIEYNYKVNDSEDFLYASKTGVNLETNYALGLKSDLIDYTYEGLISGNTYELWMEIYDKDNKLIWTTKQVETDPETGKEIESGTTVELEALQIASIEANRRQEYSLDVRVMLDEESLERLESNEDTSYTYNVEVYTVASIENSTNSQGPSPVIAKTQFTKGGEYANIVDEDSINFVNGKYYTEYDSETGEYLGDIFHIEGLDSDVNYRVVVTVSDANGGTAKTIDINRKDIKTRAAVPEISVEYNYEQVAYESDAMDAEQLDRVATATVKVTNDAVIDYEYLVASGFNFKLYKGETVDSNNLVNPTKHTIRYYYDKYDNYDAMTKLEKDLAREKTADSTEHLQAWEYKIPDLKAEQSYLWNVKAISRVGQESEISAHGFTAVWQTVELVINVEQPTANSATLIVSNLQSADAIPDVVEYTINVVKLNDDNGVVYDTNGDITSFNWTSGEAEYSNTFTSEDFKDKSSQFIDVDDIENLDIDSKYVIIIEAEAENGTTRTYYELLDTTAIARVSYMGNSSYYKTLQSAVDSAPSKSNVYLMQDTRETVKFEKTGREGIKLASENNAKMITTGNLLNDESRIYISGETGIILENFEIDGRVFVKKNAVLNISSDVKINADKHYGLYVEEDGIVNIKGKNIDIVGLVFGIYNYGGNVRITTLETTSDEEAIKITNTAEDGTTIQSAIYNNSGVLNIASENTTESETKELILEGYNGIYNTGIITIDNGKNIEIKGSKQGIYNGNSSDEQEKATSTIKDGNSITIVGGIDAIVNSNGIINIENVENLSVEAQGTEGIAIDNIEGTVNVKNTTSNRIGFSGVYGIFNDDVVNIEGKNITIVGTKAAIFNNKEEACCNIKTMEINDSNEAILISGFNSGTGIYNSGSLNITCTNNDTETPEITIQPGTGGYAFTEKTTSDEEQQAFRNKIKYLTDSGKLWLNCYEAQYFNFID